MSVKITPLVSGLGDIHNRNSGFNWALSASTYSSSSLKPFDSQKTYRCACTIKSNGSILHFSLIFFSKIQPDRLALLEFGSLVKQQQHECYNDGLTCERWTKAQSIQITESVWKNLVTISYILFPFEYIKKDDWRNVRTHLYTKE